MCNLYLTKGTLCLYNIAILIKFIREKNMYCSNCGNEINEQAVICPNCGVPTGNYEKFSKQTKNTSDRGASKAFMILACIFSIAWLLIPLAWCLPMTIVYFKKVNRGEDVGTGFKVCTLLFVSTIAGILMLCDK